MSRCSECGSEEATGCACSFSAGDCIDISGSGSAENPFIAEPILDPDAANLLECGPAGLASFLPPEIADPPTCAVYRSVVQTIPSGPTQLIGFNLEHWDTDSMHDNATNNTRVTFNTAGVYVLSASVKWEGNASNDRRIELRVNATDLIVSDEQNMGQADDFNQAVATIWKFAAGDYVELQVKQNSGVDLDILTEGDVSPQLRVARVAVG